jgi:hypothetical protein
MSWSLVNFCSASNGGVDQATLDAPAAAHVAGNLVVVGVSWEEEDHVITFSDTAGNNYAPLTTYIGAGPCMKIAYAAGIVGNAANVVRAAFAAPGGDYPDLIVMQFSGQMTGDPLDSAIGLVGSSAAAITPSLVASQDNDLVVGFVRCYGDRTTTWARPANRLVDHLGNTGSGGFTSGIPQGAYAGSVAIVGGSIQWAMAMAAFKILTQPIVPDTYPHAPTWHQRMEPC